MNVFLLISLIILGVIFPKSKLLFFLIGIYLICVIGLRTKGFDYFFYQIEYLTAPSIYYKNADFPGWNLLMNLFIKNGIVFNRFIFIVALLSVCFLLTALYLIGSELGGYITFALSIFLIYPFGHEAVQTRTFLADGLILIALIFLLRVKGGTKQRIFDYSIYFVLIFISLMIHTLAVYFLFIGLIYILLSHFKYEFQIVIGSAIVLFLLINTGLLSNIVVTFLNTNKLDHWVSNNNLSLGKLIPIIIILIIWYITRKELETFKRNYIDLNLNTLYLINVQRFMDTLFLLVPLMSYDITFNRLWRIYLYIFYLLTGEYIYGLGKKISYERLFVGGLFVVVLIFIVIYENEISVIGSFL